MLGWNDHTQEGGGEGNESEESGGNHGNRDEQEEIRQ